MTESLVLIISKGTGFFIAVLVGFLFGILPILKDWVILGWRKRFREKLRKGIVSEKLKPEDIPHLAETWRQGRSGILFGLREILADSITGDDEKLKDKDNFIRELIDWHAEREPFAELPENISLQLNALKIQVPNSSTAIGQLATSLSELYATNKAELKKQKTFTFWGFIAGIFGLLLTIVSMYFTL